MSQSPLAASVQSTVHHLDTVVGPTLPLGPWETLSDLSGALRILTPVLLWGYNYGRWGNRVTHICEMNLAASLIRSFQNYGSYATCSPTPPPKGKESDSTHLLTPFSCVIINTKVTGPRRAMLFD